VSHAIFRADLVLQRSAHSFRLEEEGDDLGPAAAARRGGGGGVGR
jgi:hypothetical protein